MDTTITLPESGMTISDWDRDSGRVAFTWRDDDHPLADHYRLGRGSVSLVDGAWALRVWKTSHLGITPNAGRRTSSKITIATWPAMPDDVAIMDALDAWESAGPARFGDPQFYFDRI